MSELDLIDCYIYRKLASLLFKMVPEYKIYYERNYSISDLLDDSVYLFMNRFATYLSDAIKSDISSSFVKNAFSYVNILGESLNLELQNIIRVGILEILYTEKGVDRNQVRNLLIEKLKRDFNAFSKYYN